MGSDAGAGGPGLDAHVLTLGGVVLSMLFWAVLPVTTPHPHECCKKPDVKAEPLVQAARDPEQRRKNDRAVRGQIDALEKQKAEAEKDKGKGKKAGSEAAAPAPKKKP